MMTEISLNILDIAQNSIQAKAKYIDIEVAVDTAADTLTVFVEDDGCGIDPRVLPRIFEEMFPHAQELGGDAKRNMGIGLSVCMSIVRSHGGRMMAENRKEGGARMSFALPLEEEPTWLSEERC